jgi:hypothetical protein
MLCGAMFHLPLMILGTIRILGKRGLLGVGRAAIINLPALGLLAAGVYYMKQLFPFTTATVFFTVGAAVLYGLQSWMLTFTARDRTALAGLVRRQLGRVKRPA